MNKPIRTRYAPSPTGNLHIGGARTALFSYLYAKHNDGEFVIRVEDTDISRNTKDGEKSQLNNLAWLNIVADETPNLMNPKYAPYRQSERVPIYKKYLDKLLTENKAYLCFCSKEELNIEKERQLAAGSKSTKYNQKCRNLTTQEITEKIKMQNLPVYRLKINNEAKYTWTDMVRGEIAFEGGEIEDFIIARNDYMPTYNFAVVVDDHLMEISHVFRGEEHISNTPKQLAIYENFNWTPPTFAHLTIITNDDGKKLSKRDESVMQFIEQYKNEGYLPEAMFNFLTLLGWTPEDNVEIKSKTEVIKAFDVKRLSKAPAKFDQEKLKWINSEYIKKMDTDEYIIHSQKFLNEELKIKIKNFDISVLVILFKTQIHYFSELNFLIEDLLKLEEVILPKELKNTLLEITETSFLEAFYKEIFNIKNWDELSIKLAIKNTAKSTNVKGKNLFMPIRISTSFSEHGPEIAKVIFVLGKELVLGRIKNIISEWK